MRRRVWIIGAGIAGAIFIGGFPFGCFVWSLRYGGQEVAPDLTVSGIRALRPGMPVAEVERLIGKPLSIRHDPDGTESWL